MEIQSVVDFYHHEPLHEPTRRIRLLSIHAGNWDDDMCCNIEIHEFSTAPTYQAISYTWGAETPVHTIQLCGKKFGVRHNCLYALKQARLLGRKCCLVWVDSICINQEDMAEKASQVSIMGDIFQQAQSVLACVGAATDDSTLLFDTVIEFARIRKKQPRCNGCKLCCDWAGHQHGRDLIHTGCEWLLSMETSQLTQFEDAFYDFASRIYWSRLWIVQELLLAQHTYILCGDHSLPAKDVMFALHILQNLSHRDEKGHPLVTLAEQKGKIFHEREMDAFRMTVDNLAIEGDRHTFDLITESFLLWTMGCANRLDRVYGLLKLIQWPESCGPPTPDYGISLCELVLDVTNRLGRNWDFSDLHNLCDGLELGKEFVKVGQPAMELILGRDEDLFNCDTTTPCRRKCACGSSTVPRIAITKHVWKYGVVYQGDEEALFVTMYTCYTPTKHVELKFYYSEDSRHYCAMVAHGTAENASFRFLFWSSVQLQAGDIIAEIEDTEEYIDASQNDTMLLPVPRFCVVLRDAGHDYYKICGQAEIYGDSQWCLGATECFDSKKTRACSGHSERNKHFILCLDAQDALSYTMLGHRGYNSDLCEMPNLKDFTELLPECSNISFTGTRFSSYAMEVDTIKSEVGYKVSPFEIMRVPTMHKRLIICANCGGRFNPEVPSMRDEDRKGKDRNGTSILSKLTKKLGSAISG